MHRYVEIVQEKIRDMVTSQQKILQEAAEKIADAVTKGGILHVLGTGHSHMIAEELFYRAGGALFVNPILDSGFMLHDGAVKSTKMERLEGYAEAVLESVDIQENDVFLVVSNSGRNVLPIEATMYMKEKGLYTISITSLQHSKSVSSRHKSGKRLFELTDLTLDNYGEEGDAVLSLPGQLGSYGPTSTVTGVILAQTLMSMTIEELHKRGEDPGIIRSANLDGSDEHNERLIEKYRRRISLLR